MIICKNRTDFTKKRVEINFQHQVGFVPTMGNLHQGHLSLIEASMNENDITIVSLFVNPLQFAPNEDFENYPRTLEADIEKLKILEKSFTDKEILIFAPESNDDVFEKGNKTKVSVEGLNRISEAQDRPEHFDGVTTVLYRLFKLATPHTAYFGKKDYQQQLIVKQMVKDLMLPVIIKALPTVRENSGLAMSSRNNYLSEEEKKEGLQLHRALQHIQLMVKNQFKSFKKILPEQIKEECNVMLKQNSNFTYLEARDAHSFEPIQETTSSIVLVGAYRLGEIRILDNIDFQLGASLGS